MIIPLHIEQRPKECVVELRGLADGRLVKAIFHGILEPGFHNIEFDPRKSGDELDAGVYGLRITIDGDTQLFPIQYMP